MNGLSIPLWAVALLLAVIAPFTARAIALVFERRARERSARLLESAYAKEARRE